MQYREELHIAQPYKKEYLSGIDHIIEQRQNEAKAKRTAYAKNIFERADSYREDLKAMLGWPLIGQTADGIPNVVKEKLAEEDTYSIYRMRLQILDGLWLTGLFFETKGNEKKPLVIVQHGGLGTPEMISGVYGSTGSYNQMLNRVICHGVHAFAPQLLLWDDKHQVPFDRKVIDARLKRVGSSITAIEVYGIMRILDYFEAQNNISSFGMVGLSYGGFYTLFTAAVDTRIKSAISCSFFNKRDCNTWSDWIWQNSAEKFDDAEVACLIYPRKLYIGMGKSDNIFDSQYTVESFERLKMLCKDVGTDWVTLNVFEGNHEFIKDDEPIKQLIKELFAK